MYLYLFALMGTPPPFAPSWLPSPWAPRIFLERLRVHTLELFIYPRPLLLRTPFLGVPTCPQALLSISDGQVTLLVTQAPPWSSGLSFVFSAFHTFLLRVIPYGPELTPGTHLLPGTYLIQGTPRTHLTQSPPLFPPHPECSPASTYS